MCGSQLTGVTVGVGGIVVKVAVGGINVNVAVGAMNVSVEVSVGMLSGVETGAQATSNNKSRKSMGVRFIHFLPRRREGHEDQKALLSSRLRGLSS